MFKFRFHKRKEQILLTDECHFEQHPDSYREGYGERNTRNMLIKDAFVVPKMEF